MNLEQQKAIALAKARKRAALPKSQGYIPDEKGFKDYARTAFDQGMQGATFGGADEVTDRLGAGMASLATGVPYDVLLKEARETTKDRLDEQMREMLVTSIASNLAGGLLTVGSVGATKAGAAAGNFIRAGNTATRAVKGAAAGAASGGLYGLGTGEDGRRGESALRGGVMGATIGGAIPSISGLAGKLNTKSYIPGAQEIRKKASDLYKTAEQKGGSLKPEFTNKFLDKIDDLKPQTDIGRMVGGDDAMSKLSEKLAGIRNRPMSLQSVQELDELIGDMIDSNVVLGHVNKQGKKLLDAQNILRKMVSEADDSLIQGGKEGFNAVKEARNLWSTSYKLSDIERIIQRAEMTDNPASALKTGFRSLYNNPNKMRGYSVEEAKAIKKAAEGGPVTDLLRTAGSRLVAIITGSTTGSIGATAAAAAGSMASRGAATRIQLANANKVAKSIAKSSGLYRESKRLKLPNLRALLGSQSGELAKQ